jgi:hypothetical protein
MFLAVSVRARSFLSRSRSRRAAIGSVFRLSLSNRFFSCRGMGGAMDAKYTFSPFPCKCCDSKGIQAMLGAMCPTWNRAGWFSYRTRGVPQGLCLPTKGKDWLVPGNRDRRLT